MLSFMVLTSVPKDLRDFLIARNFLKETGTPPVLSGVLDGVEFIEIPNSIVTVVGNPAAVPPVPPTYDTRRVYMVKIARLAEADETNGKPQVDAQGVPLLIWQKTKLGAYILANSTAVNQTDAAGKNFRGRKVAGAAVWLIRDDDAAQIGVWQ